MSRHIDNPFVNPSSPSVSFIVELTCAVIVYRNVFLRKAARSDNSGRDAAWYDEQRSGSFRKTKEPCY